MSMLTRVCKVIAGLMPIFMCMGNSCACSSSGCTVSVGSNPATPPPAVTVQSISENADPVQYNTGNTYSVPCSQQPSVQPLPHTWTVHFSDGSVQSRSILWPKGTAGQIQFVNFWIDNDPSVPGTVESGYTQVVQDAIDGWNNALATNAPNTLLVNVRSSSTQSGSQVQIYEENLGDEGGEGGHMSYVSIPMFRPLNQTYLEDAEINFDAAALGQIHGNIYAAVAHELGHSLGLNHNQYTSSVMYPILPRCITTDGQTIPSWDTSWLESTYDPYFVSGGGTNTCTRACPLAVKKESLMMVAERRLPAQVAPASNTIHWKLGQGYQGRGDAFGTPLRIKRDSINGSVTLATSDHSGSAFASMQSMYLASSMVARVHILPGTQYITAPPFKLALRKAQIEQLYRHELGPDASYRPGSLVTILDKQPARTGVFADDPPLDEGTDVVVFLRPITGRGPLARFQGLHAPTLPHISKIGVDPAGSMYVPGNPESEMAAQLGGQRNANFMTILLPRAGRPANIRYKDDENSVLHELLRERGVSSPAALQNYAASLMRNQNAVAQWAVRAELP